MDVFFLADVRDTVLVEWISLNPGSKYDVADIKRLLGDGEKVVHRSSQQHKYDQFR